jgi:hypothetical protein
VTTSTSLNLRAILKTAISRSGLDTTARVVSGLSAAGKALMVAAAANALPHGVVLYVVPGDGELDAAVADVRFFLTLEGLSASAIGNAFLPVRRTGRPIQGWRRTSASPRSGRYSARWRTGLRVSRVGRGPAARVRTAAARLAGVDRPEAGAGYPPEDLADLLVVPAPAGGPADEQRVRAQAASGRLPAAAPVRWFSATPSRRSAAPCHPTSVRRSIS